MRFLVVALVVVPIVYYALVLLVFSDAGLDHLTFRTSKVDAAVVGTEDAGSCRSGGRSHDDTRLFLSWEKDGSRRAGSFTQCNTDHAAGDTMQVWVDDDGGVAGPNSPLTIHLVTLMLDGLVLLIGVPLVRTTLRKQRVEPDTPPSLYGSP
jgi:hypothetical protein